ncbi:hypothetical protein [Streptomyces sp. AA0539]|uniref:hypothetical protein n=1 Tax=Streptomyces sp. AA0539 TaxID=1210045 RepID=UPI0003671074|nr:hypothetical protein [Streptomyces sp. AA0539]
MVSPTGRGLRLFTAHPAGCARTVDALADEAAAGRSSLPDRPVALILGASGGYGLAATLAGVARHGMEGVAVCAERPARGTRTASAGWYRAVRTAQVAERFGSRLRLVNGDCFAESTKQAVLDWVAGQFGRVDVLVYSVAAPRRVDPATGLQVSSVLRPLDGHYLARSLDVADGEARLGEVSVPPATEEQRRDTVTVMGGGDWEEWVRALEARQLLGTGFRTVALSYLGPPEWAPLYRYGTLGAAKLDLERTARELTEGVLQPSHGRALTAVCGVAVTTASVAIPGAAFYLALLRRVLGDRMQSPLHQMQYLWDLMVDPAEPPTDTSGRIRLDEWELAPEVAAAVSRGWAGVTHENLASLTDTGWLRSAVHRLYGFDVPGVSYDLPAELDLPWPTME